MLSNLLPNVHFVFTAEVQSLTERAVWGGQIMIFVVCTEPVCLFVGLLYWEGFWRERELDLAQDRGQISQHAVRPSHWSVCLCVVARDQ